MTRTLGVSVMWLYNKTAVPRELNLRVTSCLFEKVAGHQAQVWFLDNNHNHPRIALHIPKRESERLSRRLNLKRVFILIN